VEGLGDVWRLAAATAVTVAVGAVAVPAGHAGVGDGKARSDPAGEVTAYASEDLTVAARSGRGGGPVCEYVVAADVVDPGLPASDPGVGVVREVNGRTEDLYLKRCVGEGPAVVWVARPTPVDIASEARRMLDVELVPVPTPTISPTAAGGGLVQLGMWLAVEPHAPVVATARVGPYWATATATPASITWDMGNGDRVGPCPGTGTPIVDLHTADEGPCGYTYHHVNRITADGAYQVTVTQTWDVTGVTFAGPVAGLASIARATTFPYIVRQIQTIGVPPTGN
jgi:hypothetical protein